MNFSRMMTFLVCALLLSTPLFAHIYDKHSMPLMGQVMAFGYAYDRSESDAKAEALADMNAEKAELESFLPTGYTIVWKSPEIDTSSTTNAWFGTYLYLLDHLWYAHVSVVGEVKRKP